MKIGIFSSYYPPHIGGMEIYTEALIASLKKHGVDTILWTTQTNMKSLQFCNKRFPVPFGKQNVKDELKDLDLLIINERFYIQSLYLSWLSYKKNIKTIVIGHVSSHLTFNNKILDFFLHIYEHMLAFLIKKYCKDFYAVGEKSLKWLEHFGIKGKGVFHFCLKDDVSKNILKDYSLDYRKQYLIPDDAIVVSFIGRLYRFKGIVQLINAFKKLAKENIYLLIAGNGELEDFVKKNTSERIIYLGAISHEDAMSLNKQSDIFCLPSESEGISVAMLEAILCESFIICTKAINNININENDCILLEDTSKASILNALNEAICMKDKLKEKAMNAKKDIASRFGSENVVRKIKEMAVA